MAARLRQLLISVDQTINCVLGLFIGGSWADETLSSRAYRMQQQGKPWGFLRGVIDALFFWQQQHCFQSYLSEKYRKQLPPELRVQR